MHKVGMTTYRNERHARFHQLLVFESSKRDYRRQQGIGWVVAERTAMWKLVNEERRQIGKPSLSLDEVHKVEILAVGHTDYGERYSRYCTELVEDTP